MDWLTALTTLAPSIVAIATLVFAYLQNRDNNRRQLQQLREQQQHEEKKAQIESEAAKERQTKERLQDVYSNAARILSEIPITIQQANERVIIPTNLAEKVAEAQKWLSMIIVSYHGDREATDFDSFYKTVVTFSQIDGFGNAENLRRRVLEFAKNDPRLK
jgi:hypothetical protein